jgi:hypothetical protein
LEQAEQQQREEAVEYVNKHEGTFPIEFLPVYLDYFEMTEDDFWSVIDHHANTDLLEATGDVHRPYVLKEPVR